MLNECRYMPRASRLASQQSHDKATHTEEIALLYQQSRRVEVDNSVLKLLNEILQKTKSVLRVSVCSILLADDYARELFFKTVNGGSKNGQTPEKLRKDAGIAHWVVTHGKPLILDDMSSDERFDREAEQNARFMFRSVLCVPLVAEKKTIGAIEVLNRLDGNRFDSHDLELLTSLADFAALTIDNAKLRQSIVDGYMNTIKVLAAAIDAKDPYTYGHSRRVAEYALMGANALKLPSEDLQAIEHAGILHDIGKIAVSDSILRKPAGLTPEEWKIMREHPGAGAEIIADVPFLEDARNLILDHHEKYDGSGYPNELGYEDIPPGARLLAVSDAFDTMTTDRAYRTSLGVEHAITELRKCKGTQFCPEAVEAFVSGLKSAKDSK